MTENDFFSFSSVVVGWQVKREKRILCFDKTSPHNHCNVGYWLSKIWVALKRAGVLSSLSCSLHVFFIWRRCLFGFWFLVSCFDLFSYFPRFSSISLEGDKSSSGTSNFLQNAAFGMTIIYNIMKLVDILVRLKSFCVLLLSYNVNCPLNSISLTLIWYFGTLTESLHNKISGLMVTVKFG